MANSKDENTIQTKSGAEDQAGSLSQEKIWVVKANSRILGPFSFEEVAKQLREKRLVPHDEIAAPKGRWRLIRQEEKFRAIVNEIRNKQSSRGEKAADQTSSGSITMTESTAVIDNFKNAKTAHPVGEDGNAITRDVVKSYSFTEDGAVQRRVKRTENVKVIAALIVFVLAGVFTFFKVSKPEGVSHGDSFQEAMAQAQAAEKVGDYSKALTYYSEARNLKPNDTELLLHLAPLTLIHEKQTMHAGRMFKQLLESATTGSARKTALMGLGLVALESHELDAAQDYFSKVLAQDPQNTAALFNIGIVNYFKDKFDDAESYLVKALDKGGTDGAVVISVANVDAVVGQESKSRPKLNNAHDMLRSYLDVTRSYRAQVLVQDAYVLNLLNKNSESTKALESILDMDPDATDLFLTDWHYYRGLAKWERTYDTVKKILPNLEPSNHLTAVQGLVMYHGNDKLDGAQLIEKALSQDPKDPLVMALAGWSELKLGRKEAGVANIKEAALLDSKYKLPKIMRARLCMEEKDFDCAQKNWEEILKTDQRSVEAYHGLALIAWQKKDTAGATRWLRQGQAMDPKYIPFLILNAEIHSDNPADSEDK